MNIWKITKWEEYYLSKHHRSGLRIRYEKNVDPEVKRAFGECIRWLRSEYIFPKRVNIYVKESRRIKSMRGDMVCGTFFRPADRDREPYIRLSAGDYSELTEKIGQDNALAALLDALFHELTHYYQWLNDLNLTFIGEERQATTYAKRMLNDYAQTREHP